MPIVARQDRYPFSMADPTLILASSSPRRSALLGGFGVSFSIVFPDVDESVRELEAPAEYVRRVAQEKAIAVPGAGSVVLAADTAVVVDDRILGKPRDPESALAMLSLISGRQHSVFSGVAVALDGSIMESIVVRTEVTMAEISAEDARWYVESREPLDKAGAYAIQGIGGVFVTGIQGSVSNVTGLPLKETAELLRRVGIELFAI